MMKRIAMGILSLISLSLTLVLFQNLTSVNVPATPNDLRITTFETNSVYSDYWRASNASDGAIGTVYSSNFFLAPNHINPNIFLITKMSNRKYINRIILGARQHPTTKANMAFPVSYKIFVEDSVVNDQWNELGTFSNQPDSLGIVTLNLDKLYYTRGIKLVPLVLEKDLPDSALYYLQIAEIKFMGPTVYRPSTGHAEPGNINGAVSVDGKEDTVLQIHSGSNQANTTGVVYTFHMDPERLIRGVYLKAEMIGGVANGFPARYRLETRGNIDTVQGVWVDHGEYTAQPNANGDVVLNLKSLRTAFEVRITPILFGPLASGGFGFRLVEANMLGIMKYDMTSAYSNDVQNAAFSWDKVIDELGYTFYSSGVFPTALNTRGSFLGAWQSSLEPVSKVVLFAKMSGANSQGFPKSYSIYIANPANDAWVLVDNFTQQPNSQGIVEVNLGKTYLTYGVIVIPIELGTYLGAPQFQLIDINLLGW